MKFSKTKIPGLKIVDIEPVADERGIFARTWCEEEFKTAGLSTALAQFSISFNKAKGTLRGMHYQLAPATEIKLIRCTQGSVFDVIIDLREDSPTFRQWVACELTAQNHRALYVPEGLAHGFITLEDNTEMFYQISAPYAPASATGVRWNDPSFKIEWPLKPTVISPRDAEYKDFDQLLSKVPNH